MQVALSNDDVIDFTADVPGLRFEKPRSSMTLWQGSQSVEFRFRPEGASFGTACSGWVRFWLSGVILAEVPMTIIVADNAVPEIFRTALVKANARPYRLVFPSYSHADTEVVERLETYAASFGDEYLRDVKKLRTGELWNQEIELFIRRADVFQLFWSENAAASPYVEQEWRQALLEREQDQIRFSSGRCSGHSSQRRYLKISAGCTSSRSGYFATDQDSIFVRRARDSFKTGRCGQMAMDTIPPQVNTDVSLSLSCVITVSELHLL